MFFREFTLLLIIALFGEFQQRGKGTRRRTRRRLYYKLTCAFGQSYYSKYSVEFFLACFLKTLFAKLESCLNCSRNSEREWNRGEETGKSLCELIFSRQVFDPPTNGMFFHKCQKTHFAHHLNDIILVNVRPCRLQFLSCKQRYRRIREKKCRNFRTFLFVVTAVPGVCQNPLCFQIIVWVKIIASKKEISCLTRFILLFLWSGRGKDMLLCFLS